jgi:hypothetical protein
MDTEPMDTKPLLTKYMQMVPKNCILNTALMKLSFNAVMVEARLVGEREIH